MRVFIPLVSAGVLLFTANARPLTAVARVSLGYGLQFNTMLNSTLGDNTARMVANSGGAPLVGTSGSNAYNSNWSADGIDTAPYTFVQLPELRFAMDWGAASLWRWGLFGALSGMAPQTSSYDLGTYTLREANICSGVNYGSCPLAALNFVSSSGSALYNAELRTNQRFANLQVGFTLAKKVATFAEGDLIFSGEMGLNLQTFSQSLEFVANSCSTGESTPCNASSSVRVVQSEMTTTAALALGPVVGASLRYERPSAIWFAELGISTLVMYYRLENHGYTSFAAAGTLALSQSSGAQGIDSMQNVVAVLPAIVLRAGVRL